MFLLRSAFWLTLAFLVIRPETDIGSSAASLSNQAMAQGSHFISEQLGAIECDTIQCHGGKAMAVVALQTAPALALEPVAAPVPLPRPRPERPA